MVPVYTRICPEPAGILNHLTPPLRDETPAEKEPELFLTLSDSGDPVEQSLARKYTTAQVWPTIFGIDLRWPRKYRFVRRLYKWLEGANKWTIDDVLSSLWAVCLSDTLDQRLLLCIYLTNTNIAQCLDDNPGSTKFDDDFNQVNSVCFSERLKNSLIRRKHEALGEAGQWKRKLYW